MCLLLCIKYSGIPHTGLKDSLENITQFESIAGQFELKFGKIKKIGSALKLNIGIHSLRKSFGILLRLPWKIEYYPSRTNYWSDWA